MVMALAVAVIPSKGQASFYSAQEIKDMCRKNEARFGDGLCMGFIMGVHDLASGSNEVCAPKGVTIGQVMDVVKKYLNDHPEKGHYSADSVIWIALQEVWPCK
jgi:hypothetical protein